jgi:hypothetical protein
MVTQALAPLLRQNKSHSERTPSRVVNISARVGSIGDNK